MTPLILIAVACALGVLTTRTIEGGSVAHAAGSALVVAAVGGAALQLGGGTLHLVAALALATVAERICTIDITQHRIPRTVTRLLAFELVIFIVGASAASGHWTRLAWALGGGLAVGAAFLLWALVSKMGLADVKLASLGAIATTWFSWQTTYLALFVTAIIGVATGTVALARRGNQPVAFGPSILGGFLIAVLLG